MINQSVSRLWYRQLGQHEGASIVGHGHQRHFEIGLVEGHGLPVRLASYCRQSVQHRVDRALAAVVAGLQAVGDLVEQVADNTEDGAQSGGGLQSKQVAAEPGDSGALGLG